MPTGALSVSQYLEVVNATLATIPPEAVVIEGEIADYRLAQDKWITFLLKDEVTGDKLPCFATSFQRLPPGADGMRVRVQGAARLNGKFGKFSLNITALEPVGEGALKQAYEALKRSLEAEGLFAAARKRSLPKYPQTVGLITSKEAAAYGDFLRILNNRQPGLHVIHINTQVQGQFAVSQIVQAFTQLNALTGPNRPEVIILTRGGGAFEELHAFNDEQVARAIYSSSIPVLVGVGHERDETLADFVADVRASTPSNAAERLVVDRTVLLDDLSRSRNRWLESLNYRSSRARISLERFMQSATYVTTSTAGQLSSLVNRLQNSLQYNLRRLDDRLVARTQFLQSVNPRNVLARGYALLRSGPNLIRSVTQAPPGTPLTITLADGEISATIQGQKLNLKQTSLL
jgi:exodeoxyribonuclease VII large subunit